jgi:hypothetical protein
MTLNFTIFRSTDPKGQLSYCHHIASVFCCTSYFGNISSFDLLWNHLVICNQTLQEWYMKGPEQNNFMLFLLD